MRDNKLARIVTVVLLVAVPALIKATGSSAANPLLVDAAQADSPDDVLGRIRNHIQQLSAAQQAKLYQRHLRSVLALCEDGVLKLQFVGPNRDEQTKELLGYLKAIESGLINDAERPETHLAEGRRSLALAR